jgi:hypothetical protein
MPELDVQEFKAVFRPRDAYDEDILWALGGGKDDLIGYVGAAAVADYGLATPTDPLRAAALKRAHGHFAYAVLTINAGSTLREGGRVKRESKFAGESEASVEYETPQETEMRAEQQRELGRKAIAAYLTPAAETIIESREQYTTAVPVLHGW